MRHESLCTWTIGVMAALSASGSAQTTARVSVGPGGAQANAGSWVGKISAEGRFVTFASAATNLVPADSNGFADVFEHELSSGTTTLSSVTATGIQADGPSSAGSISSDGHFTVFTSEATNLVGGDTFGNADVFVRDRVSGAVTRVSVNTAGTQADHDSAASASAAAISADGRFAVFTSDAFNLAPSDWNDASDVFVHDVSLGTTTLVSVALDGNTGNGLSTGPSISSDGRYVAFASEANNLVTAPLSSLMNVYVRDLQSGITTLIGGGFYSSISPDGRFVAYVRSVGLVFQVFLDDTQSNWNMLVSSGPGGGPGNDNSSFYLPSVSTDGYYVAFASAATNLVPGDTNGRIDVFVRNMTNGLITRASVGSGGQAGDGDSTHPSISPDGRFVAFQSQASNLVAGDTNGASDVFVHDRGADFFFTPRCLGDGSTVNSCPCGNNGAAGNGCGNSVNPAGGNLDATGIPSVSADTVVFLGSGMPDSTVLYYQGSPNQGQGPGVVFGDGLRCQYLGSIVRLGTKTNSAGASQYPQGGDLPVSIRGAVSPGDQCTYQCWYRNAAAFCTPATFNLTNGLETVWQA